MTFGPLTYTFGFVAGLLSVLSPCVLPLLPIVAGTAVSAHPRGVIALTAGLAVSFALVGIFIASIGFSIGLDADWLRRAAAILLITLGVVLLSTSLRKRFAMSTAVVGSGADAWLRRLGITGLGGQLVTGLLLGIVWAPCVGPTLGAAALVASQGRDFAQVALVMTLFGVGAAAPMALVGAASRRIALRIQGSLVRVERAGTYALAFSMIALGMLEITGLDRTVEAALASASPGWLTALTTRF